MKSLIKIVGLALVLLSCQNAFSEPAKSPQVKMETSLGDIVIELYTEKAPLTVANFLTYVQDGFYNGTIFHRVINGFMIQGGGFTQDFTRKETRPPILNEANNGLSNDTGTIAMARTFEPHSATAQFFINVENNIPLNHTSKTPRGWGYTVFGRVVKGMDVVDKIRSSRTSSGGPFRSDVPVTPIVINKVTLLTK